ncbi:hypothetical protein [uncultured Maribacter sp.]|uniref:hypothetical protein n=1 Tax=uncultured Maribacter sp. TaxID=431308 RepID=UPI0026304AD4|nr:hypothetical protein [uncultured Maribacter sp.]
MKKITSFLFVLLVSLNVFSQDAYIKLPQAKTKNLSYIFNKNVIGNESVLKGLRSTEQEVKDKVEQLSVLIDKPNRETADYYNQTELGILFIDLKEKLTSKTQWELNEFFGLDKQTEVYVDGYLLESKKYKIALKAIVAMEIVEPNTTNSLKTRVLNVWTLKKSERY